MKLHTQIIFAVIVFTAFAMHQQNGPSQIPEANLSVSASETAPADDKKAGPFPQKSKDPVQDVTVDSNSLLATDEPSRIPSSQTDSANTTELGLGRQAKEDLGFLYHSEKIERDYLLKKAGLTAVQYEKIQEQRQKVHLQLQKAEAWAQTFGVNPDEAKKPILEKHVIWMQSSIGIGHYQRLQEAISSRLGY